MIIDDLIFRVSEVSHIIVHKEEDAASNVNTHLRIFFKNGRESGVNCTEQEVVTLQEKMFY